jgi:N-acetylmuramoyl-L-alanine amidase
MRLKAHRIEGVPFRAARWTGPLIAPELIVVHDTASRIEPGRAAEYLRDNVAQVSVHFVVERDGSVEQQVATNRRANHAGASRWEGREGCNGFSVGIEIVSPGRLVRSGADGLAWFGQRFGIAANDLIEMATPEHGAGLWMPYTPGQIAAVEALAAALVAGIPTIRDLRPHWYVSPGRKIDTSPLFPVEPLRARLFGRDDPGDVSAEAGSAAVPAGAWARVTAASGLNLRRWPSFNPNVLASIPDGTRLPVLRAGTFAGREWIATAWGGHEGWVVRSYTVPD